MCGPLGPNLSSAKRGVKAYSDVRWRQAPHTLERGAAAAANARHERGTGAADHNEAVGNMHKSVCEAPGSAGNCSSESLECFYRPLSQTPPFFRLLSGVIGPYGKNVTATWRLHTLHRPILATPDNLCTLLRFCTARDSAEFNLACLDIHRECKVYTLKLLEYITPRLRGLAVRA